MSNSIVYRKILIIIGDQNFYKIKYNGNYSSKNSKVWIGDEFIDYDKSEVSKNGIIPHLIENLDDYGIYLIPVRSEDIGKEICFDLLDKDIFNYLTLSNNTELSLLYKVGNYLKSYKEHDSSIVEVPQICGVIYNGGIQDSRNENVVEKYELSIKSFISNMELFIKKNFSVNFNSPVSVFKFIDNSCKITASSTIGLDEYEFNYKNVLLETQRKLLFTNYSMIETQNGTLGSIDNLTEGSFKNNLKQETKGYKTDRGVNIYNNNIPGFLYSEDDLRDVAKVIKERIVDVFKFGSTFSSLTFDYYRFVNDLQEARFFYTEKIISQLDLSDIDLNKESEHGQFVGKKLTKEGSNFSYEVTEESLKFTHVLFFNENYNIITGDKSKYFVGWIKMYSPQVLQKNQEINFNIKSNIEYGDISIPVDFNVTSINFNKHSKDSYLLDQYYHDEEIGYLTGISSKSSINKISTINEGLVLNELDRSDRITNNIELSGDSLFIKDDECYRDRDNSVYSPFINFPTTSVNLFEDIEKQNYFTKNIKIGFDVRKGLFYWGIEYIDENNLNIYICLTSVNKTLKYKLNLNEDLISIFKEEYEKIEDSVRISFAINDLIVNFKGRVFKLEVTSFYEKNNIVTYNSNVGEIYKNKGYIIFPAWYDLWNICYIIINNEVKFMDCSGEIHELSNYKNLENCAYVQNFPGPKNIDYKNIISSYLIGGLIIRELLLQGIDKENISIYDSSVIAYNDYKIDIYPMSYKYWDKISLKKKTYFNGELTDLDIENFFLTNEGFGFKLKLKQGWFYNDFYYVGNRTSNIKIEKSEDSKIKRIVNSRGVRAYFSNNKIGLI